jgi:carboxymethylenebutenolidase
MTRLVALTAIDGAHIHADLALPEHANGVGLIVIQEVFGVTTHIRAVADDYATSGYTVLAPRLFDRIEAGVELACDDAGMARGRELVTQLGFDAPMRDVRAAADWLLARGCRSVAIVGYCWGGVIAYLAVTRLGLPAVSYYGRLVPQFLHERPQAALLFHFGERDALIPNAVVDAIAARLPQVPLHRYPAGHAFNRLGDPHGDPACAMLAKERTLAFLRTHSGQGSQP